MGEDKRLEMDIKVFLGGKNVIVRELDDALIILTTASGIKMHDVVSFLGLCLMVPMVMSRTMHAMCSGIAEAAGHMMVFGTIVELHVPTHGDEEHHKGHQKGTDLQQTFFHGRKNTDFL